MSRTADTDWPLPLLTDANRFYWQSGRDGQPRFQKCVACDSLIHPRKPVCPYCGEKDLVIAPVCGRGVVSGHTINHHVWSGAVATPYSTAYVAIEDAERVRVVSNIIDCEPDEVFVGMRVEVRFEQHENVWIPLFAPTGAKRPLLPAAEVEPSSIAEFVRPIATKDKFESKVALTGIGMLRPGRRLMHVDPLAMTIAACREAIADAGLRLSDIDRLASYPGPGATASMTEGGVTAIEEALRVRPIRYNSGQETFGPSGSVVSAILAVAAGLCRHVLCFRTVWESTYVAQMRDGQFDALGRTRDPNLRHRVVGSDEWGAPFGVRSVANNLAIHASHHFARYGTTRETLGWIALNARANAALNPDAIYRDPMSMDDYLRARLISTPFGLYDCDVPCDAATAVVVSSVEAAVDGPHTPVFVEAVGTQIIERVDWQQSSMSQEPHVLGPVAHLWSRTDLGPGDVDVALLYDGFTFNCLSWIEALGFCGIGEGRDFRDGGRAIARDGAIPVNLHGGQLSAGRTHGLGFVHEAVTQLRAGVHVRSTTHALLW